MRGGDVLDDTGPRGRMIMELLRATVRAFLTTHHFRPTATGAGAGARTGLCAHHRSEKQVQVQVPEHSPRRESKSKSKSKSRSRSRSKSQFSFHSNALGTNVRMPSFRHGTTAAASSESRLDQTRWSIVKRGMAWSRGPKPPEPEPEPAQMGEDVPFVRPATALPLAAPGATTLLSQEGKIVRAPFALSHVLAARTPEAHHSPSSSSVVRASPPLSRDVCADEDAGDEMAVYINPVTKVTSFVNQRTGLVVKPNSSNSRDRSLPKRLLLPPKPPTSSCAEPSLWISEILKNWENPIFQPPEPSIPHVAFEGASTTTQKILHGRHHHCSQLDIDRAFRDSASGIAGRISKEALKNAEVVSQVDVKFILVKLRSFPSRDDNMLVLVDQHAADERIRVETLMEELCTPESSDSGVSAGSSILSSCLDKPLHFEISPKEIQLLIAHQSHFANWGILYSFSSLEPESLCQHLTVHSLPPGISERCKLDPRLLIDLLRAEVHKVHDAGRSSAASLASENWLQRIHDCPQGILDLLNSRACRSAIMFNDELSRAQCEILVARLAECAFPFQCAHGRPSLVPLVDVGGLRMGGEVVHAEGGDGGGGGGGGGGFGARFRRWKEGGVCVYN
ncbi:DNA mismatch repair protein [Drepanopeziza brunnea f. sp. 'multigermtubi' MB_m1]|uniref:DNA mismatch repair protein n=1 Tax=Marssonina brunnea f. sp. multigermtubi (strain MB_m1) TaxID=1072389 RepID=K1XUQ7_MARBU|nr:DNA mismatch repair protein [Drepanopeziza brunnea f. sp. 'multigermtubi' MB_m1]EKD16469.1 DNA mismatch repair protein [Drepanopeziza brunnea f. sp. 'multigermtubi' MB_m1]